MIDWSQVLQDIFSGTVLLAIGGIGGWFSRVFFKEKKDALKVVERKNKIYQPLIDDLEKYSKFSLNIMEKVKTPFLSNVIINQYKFAFDDDLLNKCNYLYSVINEYNSIDVIKVAHSIIANIFEEGYKEIYGSIVVGVINRCDEDRNEWDKEVSILRNSFIPLISKLHSKSVNLILVFLSITKPPVIW